MNITHIFILYVYIYPGGTLSKSLNRGFATFLAGALGIGADYFASLFGKNGEPIVLGILVFLLGIYVSKSTIYVSLYMFSRAHAS